MTGASSSAPAVAVHSFEFLLNGEPVTIEHLPATTTLLHWLRATGRTGSKCGCDEGDCGACTVALVDRDAKGHPTYRAINSCIALLPMFAGREVVTVEGLANGEKLHPVQESMVAHYGSQCGYCTPGFVVSMFEAYHRPEVTTPGQISDQLCGNLCRCTGYRPIRDAALAVIAERGKTPAGPKDRWQERLQSPVPAPSQLAYTSERETFFRPTTLAELLELRARLPDASLVAGATEIGVDLNKKSKSFPALISVEGVAELRDIRCTESEWIVGGAATLTTIEETLDGEIVSLAQMLSLFAARQIRNRATLGGNLVTASPIGDSAPVLLSLDANVILASVSGERILPLAQFFTGYRATLLRKNEIVNAVVIPRFHANAGIKRTTAFQKVSHRRELDISIVAAAFCVDTDADGFVRHARIAYGGVAPTPQRAKRAEAALEGKKITDAEAAVAAILADEFAPIDDVRGSAAYRRGVILGLWKKFVAEETSTRLSFEDAFAPATAWPVTDVSKQLRHESAVGHVTGRAQYVDDQAARRPMLEIWPVLASHARAKIVRRDASGARKMPGVVAVLMAEDVPGENNVGVSRHDETLFAKEEVCYHGHIVAIVVAETLAQAREAARAVQVEYEVLSPVLSVKTAMAQESYHTEPHTLVRGDSATAIARASRRLDGEFEFGGQEHFYLETQAAWAEPGDDGDVVIQSSTQHPSEIQAIVSEVLHLPRNKIVVQSPRMGGGFGGKETQGNTPAALVALAALKTGRPVRLQFDRDIDMTLTGKRHPFWSRFKVGFADDGRLLAVEVQLVSDGGWSLDLSQPVLDRALFHLDNAYYIPAVKFTGRVAKTNVASNTAFRGFGGPQGMLVIEEIMDRVARAVKLPPEVVRERNLYHGSGETNSTHYLEDVGDNRLQKLWSEALSQSEFSARRRAVTTWNETHPHVKRGLAITPVKFGISFTLTHYNQAGALLHAYQDGTVQVNHGGTEMGQGLHTKVLGVAMRELGLPRTAIRMMRTSTDKVPNTSATAASSGADLNGAAVTAACVALRERLAPVAAGLLARATGGQTRHDATEVPDEAGAARAIRPEDIIFSDGNVFAKTNPSHTVTFAEVCARAYVERVSLSVTGYYRTPGIYWDWSKAAGRPFAYFACGVGVSEVEVDLHTGMSRVLRVDIVHDVGDSLNPGVDRGQIEGGFVQGMGWLTSEELKWDEKGRLLTHSASTYQIPAISDAPVDFRVTLLSRASQDGTVHGSKAVGEPPLMLAISVREAIRDAVAAIGDGGGPVALASPATAEAVFAAMRLRQTS
jgi:xanthine dehydrogenase molybdopterin binding subunit/xanthine dehydrogenase small subunit